MSGGLCVCKKKSVAATRKGGGRERSVNSLIVETTCVPVPHHLCKQKCTYVCRQESCNAPAFPSRLSSNSCRVSIVGGGCEFVSYFKIQIFSRSQGREKRKTKIFHTSPPPPLRWGLPGRLVSTWRRVGIFFQN